MKGHFCLVAFFLMIAVLPIHSQVKNVEVIIEGPESIHQEEITRYALIVKNIGSTIVKNVIVRVKIPAGMKYKERINGTMLSWNLGDLGAKQGKVFYYNLDSYKKSVLVSMLFSKNPHKLNTFKTILFRTSNVLS